jgi:hypothetical protein
VRALKDLKGKNRVEKLMRASAGLQPEENKFPCALAARLCYKHHLEIHGRRKEGEKQGPRIHNPMKKELASRVTGDCLARF